MSQATTAQLISLDDQQTHPLGGLTTLGRSRDAGVFLPDQRVSRQHALIRQQGSFEYWFSDLGSSNGSSINGQRVTTSRRLTHGDVLRICDFTFRVELPDLAPVAIDQDITAEATLLQLKTSTALMLVSDLRGFTALSEKLAPDQLAQVVGSWYKACQKNLDSTGATIDKFIGDAVFAYWMEPADKQLEAALLAATQLVQACRQLDHDYRPALASSGLTLDCGVGLHAGKVVSSPVAPGVQTILGDPVNVTFRLEALSRHLPYAILLSGEACALGSKGDARMRPCGAHEVKGRTAPLDVFGLPVLQ